MHTWIAFVYVSFEWSEHLSACKQSLLLLGKCHSVILPINFLVTLQKKKLITSKINYIKQFIRYEKGSNWTISIIEWKKVLRDEQSTSPLNYEVPKICLILWKSHIMFKFVRYSYTENTSLQVKDKEKVSKWVL